MPVLCNDVLNEPDGGVSVQPPDRQLVLPPEQMRDLGYRVIDMLVEQATSLGDQPVLCYGSRPAMEALLREPLPEDAADPMAVLELVERDVLGYSAHLTHPRFFAFVPSPSNFIAVLAETLTASFNLFCGSWLVSSGPAEIELITIDWLRQLCGLPESAGGLFVSGGSVATLTALVAARETRLGADTDSAVIYCSDQTHSAVEKDINVLGMRHDQIRMLPSDERFRLPTESVRRAVDEDRRAGRKLPDWEIVTGAQLGIVTFRSAPALLSEAQTDDVNQAVVGAMLADGFALVTSTIIRDRNVLRFCTINPRTSEDDIRETVRRLDVFAQTRASIIP